MWPEVEKVQQEHRHELVLGGPEITKRISEESNGSLDPSIFNLTGLNFLDIHDTNLDKIPDEISNLTQLQSLVLNGNKLATFNRNITKLEKLKLLDISRNCLEEIPEEIDNLTSIVTLNFTFNQIGAFPRLAKTAKLSVLDLSNNKLEIFPDLFELAGLFEVKLSDNQIAAIPPEISKLSSLKVLEISGNRIKAVPGELADCNKLKTVNLKNNPVSDRRLLKLIDQCRTKQIIDYVKAHSPKTAPQVKNKDSSPSEDSKVQINHKYTLKISYANEANPKIVICESVKTIREFFVACLVKNVVFTPETLKKFIQVQNKLHEGVCSKRNLATLATHDFNKLPGGDLLYTTKVPQELQIQPLNRSATMSGAELFSRLQAEANNLRKEKKRNTYSGIHKYLYLIEGHPKYPCLLNASGTVISFPPITNSDCTKITVETQSILVEVTSSESLQICKTTIEHLVREMLGILDQNELVVEQMKSVDRDGNLKVVFPSKTDFNFGAESEIKVVRD